MARWGQSRVEFTALWPEIKTRLDGGETAQQVYEHLRGAGRITMGKTAFYQNLRRQNGATSSQRVGIAQPAPMPPRTKSSPAPTPAPSRSSTVEIDRLKLEKGDDDDIWGKPSAAIPSSERQGDA